MNANDKSAITVSEQPAVRLIGMSVRTSMAKVPADCGALFARFGPRMGEVATNGGGASYGVSFMVEGSQDAFDYWAALPAAGDAPVPAGMAECQIPAGLHASAGFDSFAGIGAVFEKLYTQWLPSQNEYVLRAGAPSYEFYAADAMQTGKGKVFMPVVRK